MLTLTLLLSSTRSLSFSFSSHPSAFFSLKRCLLTTMSINFQAHAFARNPIRSKTPKAEDPFSPTSSFQSLKTRLLDNTHLLSSPNFKVLPFRKGLPLVSNNGRNRNDDSVSSWKLGWISLADCNSLLALSGSHLTEDVLVYLGFSVEYDAVYWGIDVSGEDNNLVLELSRKGFCFIELRTLMVATNWEDTWAMEQLAIAGHGRALLEWHSISHFCGHCGERTISMEAGRRKQCSNHSCKMRIYPRLDPVVIMLVIDRENDRALLGRKPRYVPQMWSCLAGFMEPGESLEEAVRRETWEETGIEVGEVVYHSSQPWPVGPNSMPCQLMVGFFAYAKSFDIHVDKGELEDAQWHNREDVRKALALTEYKKAQKTAAAKVEQMCKGVEKVHSLSTDFNIESGELAPMFIPGPSAIAHHLISTWVYRDNVNDAE